MGPAWERKITGIETDLATHWHANNSCESLSLCLCSTESSLEAVLRCCRWLLILLYCLGCYWRFFAQCNRSCDGMLWSGTAGILIIRFIAPVLSSCFILSSCLRTFWAM